jgi:hypothetical protein
MNFAQGVGKSQILQKSFGLGVPGYQNDENYSTKP